MEIISRLEMQQQIVALDLNIQKKQATIDSVELWLEKDAKKIIELTDQNPLKTKKEIPFQMDNYCGFNSQLPFL